MPENEFNVGDLVELKSGGPKMTVKKAPYKAANGGTYCEATWFDDDNKLQKDNFAVDTLKPYKD